MEKSVITAIRPRSLFASAAPVVLTVALLRSSHGIIDVVRVDALCAVAIAVLVQMLANLNAIYSTFHRAFNPMAAAATATATKDNKIVINLLSQKLVRMWSWLFLVLMLSLLGVAQLFGPRRKRNNNIKNRHQLQLTACLAACAVVTFLYCRHTKRLAIVGLQELIASVAFGPLAMGATSLLLVRTVPAAVAIYALAVLLFAMAFQIVQSTADAPFARRLGLSSTSLATFLGYDRCFHVLVLSLTGAYGILAMCVLVFGHLPNVVLLFSLGSVREICDAFREEKLHDLPDQLAKLGAKLSGALVVSIAICSVVM